MRKSISSVTYLEDEILKYPEEERGKMEIILALEHPYRWQHTPRIKEMEKLDKKNSFFAHLKGQRSWKWPCETLFATMGVEAKRNGLNPQYSIYLRWLALRLKFCNKEVDKLVTDYLHGIKNYDYSLDGKLTIFETMKKYGITYCEAIYDQYVEKTGFRPTKTIGHWIGDIPLYLRPFWSMKLNDTHTDVVLYDPHLDDYESGFTPEEEQKKLEKIFEKMDNAREERLKNENSK